MKRWQKVEREVCGRFKAIHVGGPGQPDCVGEGFIVEAKNYRKRPVGATTLRRVLARPWAVEQPLKIVATVGFTVKAIELAEEKGVELYVMTGKTLERIVPCEIEEEAVVRTEDSAGMWIAGLMCAGLVVVGTACAVLLPLLACALTRTSRRLAPVCPHS